MQQMNNMVSKTKALLACNQWDNFITHAYRQLCNFEFVWLVGNVQKMRCNHQRLEQFMCPSSGLQIDKNSMRQK